MAIGKHRRPHPGAHGGEMCLSELAWKDARPLSALLTEWRILARLRPGLYEAAMARPTMADNRLHCLHFFDMYSLHQAVHASPVLAQVAERVRQSKKMLEVIQPLMSPGLRAHVQAGPVDEASWCLLVSNPAVGSKLKQLGPALLAALRSKGFDVPRLRIKVRVG